MPYLLPSFVLPDIIVPLPVSGFYIVVLGRKKL
jgi:hypothetical protein